MATPKIRADFNGLFGDVLCLSHSDTCVDANGATIQLSIGMKVTAFDEDADETGKRDDLIASGVVKRGGVTWTSYSLIVIQKKDTSM